MNHLTKNEHLIPKVVLDIAEERFARYRSENQRAIDEARLIAIRDFCTAALEATPPDVKPLPSTVSKRWP